MPKLDILSPAFFSGLIGYAATGTGAGFWIGAVGVWLTLFGLVLVSVAVARTPDDEAADLNHRILEPAE